MKVRLVGEGQWKAKGLRQPPHVTLINSSCWRVLNTSQSADCSTSSHLRPGLANPAVVMARTYGGEGGGRGRCCLQTVLQKLAHSCLIGLGAIVMSGD